MARNSYIVIDDAEVKRMLDSVAPKQARNILRAAVQAAASRIAKQAKAAAPRGPTGALKKSIKAERKKSHPDKPVSVVKVAPSAFYWKFVEFGTNKMSDRPFIRPAYDNYRANYQSIFREEFGKKFEASLARAAKRNQTK